MAAKTTGASDGLLATVDQQALSKALAAVSGALPRRSQIPILDTVHIEAGEASLTLTVTNLDQEASIQIPATINRAGALCVDARAAVAIAGRMKGELLLAAEAEGLKVTSGRARASLPVLPAGDFHTFDEVTGVEIELASGALAAGIASVMHAVSSEETRPYLGGVYLEHDATRGGLGFTATDGTRLATIFVTCNVPETFYPPIIPRAALADIIKLCERAGQPVTLIIAEDMIEVSGHGECYRTKVLDGSYPDYRRVIPKDGGTRMPMPRRELMEALGVALSASREKSSAIRLTAEEGRVTLTVRTSEGPWAEGIVEYGDVPPAPVFGVNGRFLMQALEKLATEEVALVVTDPASPIRIDAEGDLVQVIMPLRV